MTNCRKFTLGTLITSIIFTGVLLGSARAYVPDQHSSGSPTMTHTPLASDESVTIPTEPGQLGVIGGAAFDVPNCPGDPLSLITSDVELEDGEKVSFAIANDQTSRVSIKVKVFKNNQPYQEFLVEPNDTKICNPCNGPGEYRIDLERSGQDKCKGSMEIIGLPV